VELDDLNVCIDCIDYVCKCSGPTIRENRMVICAHIFVHINGVDADMTPMF
jgi:hypothetical protein